MDLAVTEAKVPSVSVLKMDLLHSLCAHLCTYFLFCAIIVFILDFTSTLVSRLNTAVKWWLGFNPHSGNDTPLIRPADVL